MTTSLAVAALLIGGSDRALAGVGPWTLGRDDLSIYTSVSIFRFTHLAMGSGSYSSDPPPLDLGTALTETDLGAVLSYGLLAPVELEVSDSFAYSAAGRSDVGACVILPLHPCRTVEGLTPATFGVKVRVLDEFAGRPLTVSVGPTARLGDWTRPDRQRLTQIGDGQSDLGGLLQIGRTGGLGGTSSYAVFGEGRAWYRLPVDWDDGRRVPGHEVSADSELLVYARPEIGLGVDLDWEYRPIGTDIETMEFTDPDRFVGLRYTVVKGGAKLLFRSPSGTSVVLDATRTIYARNNPSDGWTASIGLAWFRAGHPARETP